MKTKLLTFCALVVGLLIVCGPMFAHHGSNVSYDIKKQVTMKGTIVAVAIQNPHSFIAYDVKDDSGNVVHWGAETAGGTRVVGTRGWMKDTLKPGDQVTVTVFPSKAGTPRGLLYKLVLDDKVIYESIPSKGEN